MIVTGIGSRRMPIESPAYDQIVCRMGELAGHLGWMLRSGGAKGADLFFELRWKGPKEIYIPWNGFNRRQHAVDGAIVVDDELILQLASCKAAEIHPRWKRVTNEGKALHTRNVFQVLGATLMQPSDICVYWADETGGDVSGGTRTAVMLCRERNIPTYNLAFPAQVQLLQERLSEYESNLHL